jgi:transcriptional regulator with XRE-family HTH domain
VDDKFVMNGSRDAATRFGRELRCQRTLAGLTQRQLADQVRYSREMVAAVERGRRYGSHMLARRCDEVLGTDGVLARMWPAVEIEQVAADRRRGPRPERPARVPQPVRLVPQRGAPERPGPVRRPRVGWAEWAEQLRPAMGAAPPELVDQLRTLINNLVLASDRDGSGTDAGTGLLYRPVA